jgi:prevent-host-death family protein
MLNGVACDSEPETDRAQPTSRTGLLYFRLYDRPMAADLSRDCATKRMNDRHRRQYGYNGHVEVMVRTANIAQLRDRLTQYLREVRAGEEIIVRDRQRPIAKIIPLTMDAESDDEALVAAGLMRKATRRLPATFWRTRRGAVTLRAAAAAVSEDRDER